MVLGGDAGSGSCTYYSLNGIGPYIDKIRPMLMSIKGSTTTTTAVNDHSQCEIAPCVFSGLTIKYGGRLAGDSRAPRAVFTCA